MVDDGAARQGGEFVAGEHGQAERADLVHDRLIGERARLPLVDDMPLMPAGREPSLAVGADRVAERASAVQQVDLAPQVHEAFRRGRAGQAHHPVHVGAAAFEDAEAFRVR